LPAFEFVWGTVLCERLRSHLHGRPCAVFPDDDAERESRFGVVAGTPLLRLFSLQRMLVASRAIVSRMPVSRHAVPLRRWLVPARSSLDRGYQGCVASLPLRISDAERFGGESARRGPIAGDLDFVFDRNGDSRSSTSVVWLAIRTSRPYLSATNVRLEHIRLVDRACEHLLADRCPVAGHAPWAPLRPAFRYPRVNGRRATWPTG